MTVSDDAISISASELSIRQQVDACIAARQRFDIHADSEFPHKEALGRWLRIYQGERDERGFFRGLKDSVVTGDVIGCLSAAVNSAGYSWDFEQTPTSLTITFDPDPDALPHRNMGPA
ncbi:MAG: hypothetical protein AAGC99_11030 [Pseudomonadota bacterium]